MYKNQLAVAIKHNGKILRENKDLVQLPFGSEFSVLVKNLNSRRVKFTLHIDGTDVLDGQEIIVNANSETEMKRFIRNGNMNEGNAFKFIERTAAIEDGPRGIKVDDGIVRVEFWFEQEAPTITTTVHHHYDEWHYRYPIRKSFWDYPYGGPYYGVSSISGSTADLQNVKLGSTTAADVKTKGIMRGMTSNASAGGSLSSATAAAYNVSSNAAQSTPTMDSFSPEVSEAGITVPGSKVEQKFTAVYGFNAETVSHVIVLRLAGKIGTMEVAAPVTVKTKQKCETCGKVNKATSKFCSGCGTSLELL
jgi:hypothetical protein